MFYWLGLSLFFVYVFIKWLVLGTILTILKILHFEYYFIKSPHELMNVLGGLLIFSRIVLYIVGAVYILEKVLT